MPSPRRPSPAYPRGADENQPFLEWLNRQLGDALGSAFESLGDHLRSKSPVLLPWVAYGSVNITLQLSDAHSLLRMNSSSARTITVPPNNSVPFSLGTVINVFHEGTGALSFVQGTGVTIRSRLGSLTSSGQYAVQTLIKLDINNWSLSGGLT